MMYKFSIQLFGTLVIIRFDTPYIGWFLGHQDGHQVGKTRFELGTSLKYRKQAYK